MALATEAYVTPVGQLHIPTLWPRLDGESESERDDRALEDIDAYRVQAYGKTTDDDLSQAWVNYRAWSRYADILNAIPANAANDEGSRSYLAQQIEYWSAKAAGALEEFEGGVEDEGSEFDIINSYR